MNTIRSEIIKNPTAFLRPLNLDIHHKASEIIEAENPGSLLDIGTGICLLLSILELPPSSIRVGYDVRMDNLLEGKNVLRGHGIEGAILVQGWGQLLPFKDNSFSAAAILTTFINIGDLNVVRNILQEIYRILKPGGLGVFEFRNKYNLPLRLKHRLNRLVEKNLPVTMFSAGRFRKFLFETGWTPEEYIPVWPKFRLLSPSIIYTARKV